MSNPVFTGYRVMATVVGILLVLITIGVPLANFDGTGMWHIFSSTPDVWAEGSTAKDIGEFLTGPLAFLHGWLYMIFFVFAFLLSRQQMWDLGFTVVVLICGTIPFASFWAEHRAVLRYRADEAEDEAAAAAATD
ncbi:DUF3817 domain-containing protein [Nocardioides alcanivorans]|uniref:DUF3817 domain-containing protein n=1 Tax=Nocardioides alcanivorans TaxID=2897352 RepID=UPI001F3576C7|nr:DUF3817 domain-containing protein [Nocardioides alcanivorans]